LLITTKRGEFPDKATSTRLKHKELNGIESSTTVNYNHIENTKESILSVCDKPYHKIKENMPHGEELANL